MITSSTLASWGKISANPSAAAIIAWAAVSNVIEMRMLSPSIVLRDELRRAQHREAERDERNRT